MGKKPQCAIATFHAPENKAMRAAAICDVMSCFAAVMDQAHEGGEWWATQEAYEQYSKPASGFDAFLSHNWSAKRCYKFLQLAFYFNLRAAIIVSLLAATCVGMPLNLLQICGVLEFYVVDHRGQPVRCYACFLSGVMALIIAYFLGMDVVASCCGRYRAPRVFLDKYCINQVDPEEKLNGIATLGSCISNSKCFVILYNEAYFERLWTIYESACHIAADPSLKHMHLIPHHVATTLPVSCALYTLAVFLSFTLHSKLLLKSADARDAFGEFHMATALMGVVAMVISGVGGYFAHSWVRELQRLRMRLASFHIEDAKCAVEDDRAIVYREIWQMEKSLGTVPEDADVADAVAQFNCRVQTEVQKAISHNGCVANYEVQVATFICEFFNALDYICAGIVAEKPAPMWIIWAAKALLYQFALMPLTVEVICLTASCASDYHPLFVSLSCALIGAFVWCSGQHLLVLSTEAFFDIEGGAFRTADLLKLLSFVCLLILAAVSYILPLRWAQIKFGWKQRR